MGICVVDMEFNESQEEYLNPVCVSWMIPGQEPVEVWLRNHPAGIEYAARELHRIGQDHTFVCYLASAECRGFMALGLDPSLYRWFDCYVAWVQLRYNNNDHKYGHYLRKQPARKKGGGLSYNPHGYSVPPSLDARENKGKDNTETGKGLIDCTYHLLGTYRDSLHKTKMRDLIISNPSQFTADEMRNIMAYCTDDIRDLPQLYFVLLEEITKYLRVSRDSAFEIICRHSEFAGPTSAKIESNGIPMDLEAVRNLINNVHLARHELIAQYVKNVEHPFYVKKKANKREFSGHWVDNYQAFEDYIRAYYDFDKWPKTKPKPPKPGEKPKPPRLSKKEDDLKEFDGDANIRAYRKVKKALSGLQSFDPTSKSARENGIITDAIGRDGRLRTLFGVFGTQTGRNAPRARKFPFAMGSWARALIRCQPGEVILGFDWKNQEFAIAAALSGDPAMWEAYKSGDPYMWFCIEAGGAPKGATKSTHPEARDLFKATTLGLQFGMGVEKLAYKLTVDCKRLVTVSEARRLVKLHKRIFRVYWRWVERTVEPTYKREGYLRLSDGWAFLGDCVRMTSMRNFPVQGTGAVILRRAVVLAVKAGVQVISPLHDAIYAVCKEGDRAETRDKLRAAMDQAVQEILGGDYFIRIDEEYHTPEKDWVEKKGKAVYDALKPYFAQFENPNVLRRRKLDNLLQNVA